LRQKLLASAPIDSRDVRKRGVGIKRRAIIWKAKVNFRLNQIKDPP